MIFRNRTILTVLIVLIFAVQPVFSQSSTSTPTTTGTTGTVPPATPAITQEEANAQAVAETPPPQQVFDIANSGVVYGLLSEGVSAWIAQLGGNTDKWGNELSTAYVSATRPDVVPASLQTFLLAYYKDNPTIGLAYGPEGIKEAETALDQHFNEVVAGRADEIYNDAVEEAQAEADAQQQQEEEEAADETTEPDVNDSEADNSEDVPPLDDNDNGEETPPDEVDDGTVTIASISPSDFEITSTPQKLDITGNGFGTDPAAITVDFSNGMSGTVPDSVSNTSMTVTVPDRFEAGADIAVTVNIDGETTSGVTITARPSVESVSRVEIFPSASILILGYGFASTASGNTVLFEATTEGREDIILTPNTSDFLSSFKCQLRLDSMKVSAETTGTYNLIVTSGGQQASGSTAVEFVMEPPN